MWVVVYTSEAEQELDILPDQEKVAILHAVEKLSALGPGLPYPHQSNVQGAEGLRELRPRQGRSRWRAFYCRVGDVFVIAAIGSEAAVDKRGFARAVQAAQQRCAQIDREEDDHEATGSETS